MAFSEEFVQRIRLILLEKGVEFYEKKMFAGVCFMVDDKMCLGTHIDKQSGESLLMCRVGESAYEDALEQRYVTPMEFTGKPMIGYVYVTESGLQKEKDLAIWLQKCLDFNPLAKKSKK